MCHLWAKGQAIDPKASDAHQGPWCHCVVYTNISLSRRQPRPPAAVPLFQASWCTINLLLNLWTAEKWSWEAEARGTIASVLCAESRVVDGEPESGPISSHSCWPCTWRARSTSLGVACSWCSWNCEPTREEDWGKKAHGCEGSHSVFINVTQV